MWLLSAVVGSVVGVVVAFVGVDAFVIFVKLQVDYNCAIRGYPVFSTCTNTITIPNWIEQNLLAKRFEESLHMLYRSHFNFQNI